MAISTEENDKTVNEKSKESKKGQWRLTYVATTLHLFASVLIESFFSRHQSHIDTEQEYNAFKAQVETHKKRVIIYAILPAIIMGCVTFLILSNNKLVAYSLVSRIAVSIFCAVVVLWRREVIISEKQEELRKYELSHAQNEAEEDLFQNSIKTSYKYLDRYYDQTQKQAQQGFHITVFIAVCGALLIFGGVAAMYAGFVQPAYITCASGAVTELISAIFFYLYNKTVTSMSRYHNKLVLSQNISFALRVADSLSEEKKDDAKLAIINELVKDVNAQMMKSDADADEPPKKDKPSASDAETPS